MRGHGRVHGREAIATVFLALTVLAACNTPPRAPKGTLGAGDFSVALAHDGLDRRYLLHVPPAIATGTPRPLVIVLHGAAGDAVENRDWLGLDAVGDREGFVTVYPDGTGLFRDRIHMWNSGVCCGSAQWGHVDDVGFLRDVLDDVERRTAIDPSRVYLMGFSNGAMMAYRMAAEASDRITAIVAVAGARTAELADAMRPVPVMHVHSVDDPWVPYAGGESRFLRYSVPHPPVEDVVRAWARHDRCSGTPTDTTPAILVHAEFPHGQSATRETWAPCADGTEVVLWTLHGAGHVWPGSSWTPRNWFVGRPTSVIDVREEMWRFVKRFSQPTTTLAAVAPTRG